MGFNTWNRFLDPKTDRVDISTVTEKSVLELAKAMVDSGMRDAGYEFFVMDDCYQHFRRDHLGRVQSHPVRFASGIKGLADAVHDLGLKFGLYSVPGTLTCAQQYDDYHGDDLGSLNRERIDAEAFVEWGVDYLKYDWCRAHLNDGLIAEPTFAKMAEELKAANANIVYSISEYGLFQSHLWAPKFTNLWRTTDDLFANWHSIIRTIDQQAELYPFSRPGAWNDPDMLQVGNGKLTDSENRAHMYVWAVLNAPLMAGNDIVRMTDTTRELLTHPGVIAIDQDWGGQQGRLVWSSADGEVQAWSKPMSAGGNAVALLNRGEKGAKVSLPAALGDLNRAKDVWSNDAIDHNSTVSLAPHSAELLLVS
jgi:hypothetical protein